MTRKMYLCLTSLFFVVGCAVMLPSPWSRLELPATLHVGDKIPPFREDDITEMANVEWVRSVG